MDSEDLDTRTLVSMLAERLRERVCEHPVSTLAGAATVGYMLGWSMPSPLYRTLASLGVRAAVMQVVTRLFGSDEGDDEDAELDLVQRGDDELDLSGGGGMAGDPRKTDVPPYVA